MVPHRGCPLAYRRNLPGWLLIPAACAHPNPTAMSTTNLSSAKSKVSVQNLALRYGGVAFGLMLVYFFTVHALGFQQHQEVRFGSHAFTALAVFFAIRAYKAQARGPAPYLAGLGVGFLVGLTSSLLFAGFIFLYANLINPGYSDELQNETYFSTSLSPYVLAATIVLLGVVVGSLTGYILMMSDGTTGTGGRGESTGD